MCVVAVATMRREQVGCDSDPNGTVFSENGYMVCYEWSATIRNGWCADEYYVATPRLAQAEHVRREQSVV